VNPPPGGEPASPARRSRAFGLLLILSETKNLVRVPLATNQVFRHGASDSSSTAAVTLQDVIPVLLKVSLDGSTRTC